MEFFFEGLDKNLLSKVEELKFQLGFEVGENGKKVEVSKQERGIKIIPCDDKITLTYGKDNEFFRALSQLKGVAESGKEISEEAFSKDLCFMADVSRNAVLNMASAKRLVRYLALMGYSSMMLYTEDTFEVEGYPYFGYMRGKYTKEELKEIDDYAYGFGIEVIPCIQTLAHLSCALRWEKMAAFSDTSDIMLVGDNRTYKFIEAMLKTCKECFRSNKINIGMDEALSLGYGSYIRRNGYKNQHEIMLEHLNKVTDMCHSFGYHPMMWSDMFFRMASPTNDYYSRTVEISEEVLKKVPKDLTIIYWDYYKKEEDYFAHMVDCHLKFTENDIAFAGGAWKWSGFAPNNKFSIEIIKMQMKVCRERGIKEIIVTCWGDDGAEASQFSALASMLYFAESTYAANPSNEKLNKRAKEALGISYDALLTLDEANKMPGIPNSVRINPSKYLLYNDPIGGIMDWHLAKGYTGKAFAENSKSIAKYADDENFGYMFDTLSKLCSVLELKAELSVNLRDAYKNDDRKYMRKVADEIIPECIARLDVFIDAYRNQWYCENKPYLLANHEIRLGGLKERLKSAALRLDSYLKCKCDKIDELEDELLIYNQIDERHSDGSPFITYNDWATTATVGVM